jgi:hypothetical protein
MKKKSTWFLRGVLGVITLILAALCIFAFPAISRGVGIEFPVLASLRFPILFGLWAAAIPFFLAIYQSFKLLNYIEHNIAFSNLSVRALRRIKHYGVAMTVILMLFMPVMFMIAEADDAPGLIIISFLFFCIPIVVSVFAAVLQMLLKNAIEIKSENDLVV